MKRITYAGGSFLTTDHVADALLSFVAAIERNRRSQVLIVPEFAVDGSPSPVGIVLGPSTQIMSQVEAVAFSEPDTEGVVEDLTARAHSPEERALSTSVNRPVTFDYDTL